MRSWYPATTGVVAHCRTFWPGGQCGPRAGLQVGSRGLSTTRGAGHHGQEANAAPADSVLGFPRRFPSSLAMLFGVRNHFAVLVRIQDVVARLFGKMRIDL